MNMSDHSLLRLVKPAGAKSYTHVGYPSSCHMQLVLPRDRALAREAARFFMPARRRMIAFFRAIACRVRGGGQPDRYIATRMLDQLSKQGFDSHAAHAISVGTPGPYNKQSILHFDRSKGRLLLSKFGCGPAVVNLLDNEAAWLSRLAEVDELVGQVPRLVGSGKEDDCAWVTQTIALGHAPRSKFRRAQLDFLNILQKSVPQYPGADSLSMLSSMRRRLSDIGSKLAPRHVELLEEAIVGLEELLSTCDVPVVVAHRDFVPWNMRDVGGRLFVYDWEYASNGYTPTYDAFHFCLMPIVLKRPLKVRDALQTINTVVHAMTHMPGGNACVCQINRQFSAYLADLCLFYLESNGGVVGSDKVVGRYLSLMEQNDKWGAA